MKKNNKIWAIIFWIFLIIVSYLWEYHVVVSTTFKIVENKAQSFFNQILVSSSWNLSHGGMYLLVTEQTNSNLMDSLGHITTPDSLMITKNNLANMIKQFSENNKSKNNIQFHITSLNPTQSVNKADDWESKALKSLENDKHEILELVKNDSTSLYRYMLPLVNEKSCLKCHGDQDYKLGEIRGGISISFPSLIYDESEKRQLFYLFIAYSLILLVGLFGISRYFSMMNKFFAIIERKNLKLETDGLLLQRSIEELKKSREDFKELFDNAPVSYHEIDNEGRIVRINETELNMLGYSIDELLGRFYWELNVDKVISQQAIAAKLSGTIAPSQPFEREIRRKDGTTVPVLIKDRILKDKNGSITGIRSIVQDITDRKQAEEEIKLKNEQLRKINAEKDKFFSFIAHDLRSPFNSFLGLTQIMAEELPSLTLDELQKMVVSMEKSATNLFLLLENLLQWSRIQQGLIPFNPEVLELLPILDESIAIILEPAKNKGIEIVCDIPDDLVSFADRYMLQTVIRNLVSNAVKFTPKGGKVTLSAKTNRDKNVEISIKDTGIGMNKAMTDQLFRIDVQTNRVGTDGESSTGLGLILCKEFIEKHGGKIWVESEVGKGSMFYFTLPSTNNK